MKAFYKKADLFAGHSIRLNWVFSAIILFIPFVAVFIYTSGLKSGLDSAFSIDEPLFHYPTVLHFANQLPYPDVSNYNSATTPLFHILLAVCTKILGTDIVTLRLVNFFVTYASIILLFNILIHRFKLSLLSSLLFSLLFALSPYYFREAFVLLTDNLPILWLLCFFNYYFKYKTEAKQKWLLLSLLFVMLLCLTRQIYLFVCVVIAIDAMLDNTSMQTRIKTLSLLFVAALPTLILLIMWKGLTPPKFKAFQTSTSLLNIKAVLFGICVVGFYSLFIQGIDLIKAVLLQRKRLIVVTIFLFWLILFFSPMIKDIEDFGYLWYIAAPLPKIAGTSLFFWLMIPIGIISLLSIWNKEGVSILFLFLICLFISQIPSRFIFQRYYDNSVLLVLIFFSAKYLVSNKIDFIRRAVLIAFFIAYFVVFTVA